MMNTNIERRVRVRLVFVTGPRMGEVGEYDMVGTSQQPQPFTGLLIGRNKQNAIVIDSKDISRQHAELLADDTGNIYVRDNGSINGTLINGMQTVSGQTVRLRSGDHVTLGLTEFSVEWRVEMSPTTPQPQYVPPPLVATAPAMLDQATIMDASPLAVAAQQQMQAIAADDQAIPYLFIHNGQRYRIDADEAYIGRGPTNDIVIDQPSLSRQHARIQRSPDGQIMLTDLGSTNGTFVNGYRTGAPTPLRGDTVIRFGDVLADFRFERQRMSAFVELADRTVIGLPEESDPAITLQNVGAEQAMLLAQETFIPTQQTMLSVPDEAADPDMPVAVPVEVVGRTNRRTDLNVPAPSVIQVEAVSKSYSYRRGRAVVVALNGVTLNVRRGEVVGLIGSTASGKSTLLRIVAGLEKADRGQVMVAGRSLSSDTANIAFNNFARPGFVARTPVLTTDSDTGAWRATTIGYLAQGEGLAVAPQSAPVRLLDWLTEAMAAGRTLQEATTSPTTRDERALELLARFGIGLEKLADERLEMLTPMERRLAALARTLAADPPLLLLDDPTLGLTSRMAQTALAVIADTAEREGRTILLTSSDVSLARRLSRHIEILDGEVVGST